MTNGSRTLHSHGVEAIRERVGKALSDQAGDLAFHYQLLFRIVLLLSPVMLIVLVVTASVLVDFSKLPAERLVVSSVLLACLCGMDIYLSVRMWKPALLIRRDNLTVSHFLFLHGVVLEWDQIQGVTEEKVRILGDRSVTRLRIVYRKADNKRREIILAPHVLRNGDEAARLLKRILPVALSVEADRKLDQLKTVPLKQIRYKGLELDEQGITVASPVTRERKVILWDRILRLQAEGAFDGSRGPVTLFLEFTSGASTKRLTLRGVESYEFIEFIKLIMSRVKKEVSHPDLLKLMENPRHDMNIDTGVAILIISGFVLVIAGITSLLFYPPVITSIWTYPLLLIPLCLIPLIYAIKLQLDKNVDDRQKKIKSRMAALGMNVGAIAAAAILFILSPASLTWLMADANAMMGNSNAAETYYRQAEKDLSDNADFLFAFAQYYYKNKEWRQAADYYIQAYEKDPTNWIAGPLEKIPDSLNKAGLTGDALDWCDTIASDYAKRKDVVRAMKKMKAEISKNADE